MVPSNLKHYALLCNDRFSVTLCNTFREQIDSNRMKQNKTWVCTVCSQTFTRNSSAKRHNISLHEGKGVCVRFIDYEIGRVQGKYFQNNPIFYKKKSAISYDIPGKQPYRLLSHQFIHNSDFSDFRGYNDFVNSVIKAKDKKSSQKTFLYDKVEEVMDFVDQMYTIAKTALTENEIKKFAKEILTPYFSNDPDAKKIVEERLKLFKKNIATIRYKNYFSNS